MIFCNRQQAGKQLADRLQALESEKPVVIALPRGGVPIAYEVSQALHSPLDVLVVKKIGAPSNPEFGIGALAEDETLWLNQNSILALGITEIELKKIVDEKDKELKERIRLYRGNRPIISVKDRVVALIDDGLATGVTAIAAARVLKKHGARRVILAVPVCAHETAIMIRDEIDEIICLHTPAELGSIGFWYEDFSQLTDEEAMALLSPRTSPHSESVEISEPNSNIILKGELFIPGNALGMVIFAHGGGSGRLSPRNLQVAKFLNHAGIGTLVFDLLTPEEAENRELVFDIPLLADRLILATRWLKSRIRPQMPIGYFGASTGAAAALSAAARMHNQIQAVVSRGGRPDLTGQEALKSVRAPTLLLVGGEDRAVIEMNIDAMRFLSFSRLKIIPYATHLFEEPGALEKVAELAMSWFQDHFSPGLFKKSA